MEISTSVIFWLSFHPALITLPSNSFMRNMAYRKLLPANPNIPPKAVIPLYLGKEANEFKLQDAHVLHSDFGESYHVSEVRRGEDCHTPLAMRPPEARFEPRSPLSYSADIWSLAIAIWEILGMKALFSNEYITEDEMVSEHIDVLGPMPTSWLERWEERGEFFDDETGHRPKEGREGMA